MSSDWESDQENTSISSVDSENETSDRSENTEGLVIHNLEPYMFEPELSVDQNQETEEGNIVQVDREPDFAVRVNNKDWCLC